VSPGLVAAWRSTDLAAWESCGATLRTAEADFTLREQRMPEDRAAFYRLTILALPEAPEARRVFVTVWRYLNRE